MAEDTVRVGGLPYRTSDPEQTASALQNGGSLISEAEAGSNAAAQADNSYVDANWGNAGKLGMGALSGLTLGMGPGALANMGLVNPGHLRSAEGSPWYTAGDVAGTIAPALLTGGESLGARGLAMTPAGLMGRAGGLAENWAGRLLGDSAGLLGKLGSMPVKMAARGMAEGGLINMGHAVGDALIDNKPLAAEAIGAAGLDGALFGGLMGGTLGMVGGLGALAVDSIGNLGKKALSRSGLGGVATVGKSLGMEGDALSEAGARGKVGKYGELLHENGSSIGDSVTGQQAATQKAVDTFTAARKEALDGLSKDASGALDNLSERLSPRLKTDVVYPRIGTPLANQAEREVEKFWTGFSNEKPMGRPEWNEANNFKSYAQWQEDGLDKGLKGTAKRAAYDSYKQYADVQFTDYAKTASANLGKAEFPKTWEGLIAARDQLEKGLAGKVNNPLLPTRDTIRREILNAVDHEIGQAMDGVSSVPGNEGLADKYRGATQSLQVARELEGHLGKKLTNQMMSSGSGISGADAGWAMTGAALGHPVSAIGLLAAKGISRNLQPRATAWMAQMAYNQSFGTKAAAATQEMKNKVSSSLKAYFKGVTKAPATAANVDHAREANAATGSDRKSYESMASRAEQLVSSNHQAQVQKYAESMAQAGYTDLAQSVLDLNHRAVMYAMNNAPPRQGTKQMSSMHKIPTSKTPTLQEFKYMRQMKGVFGGPHAIVDGLMKGNLSRDTVQAVAYTYPESVGYIAEQAQTEIMEMKARGDTMPMDKIVRLGVALNSPIDRTLDGDYVGAVQSSLAAPDASQPKPPPQGHPGGSLGDMGMAMMTPLQTITIGQS